MEGRRRDGWMKKNVRGDGWMDGWMEGLSSSADEIDGGWMTDKEMDGSSTGMVFFMSP